MTVKSIGWQCPACRINLAGEAELRCSKCNKSMVRNGRVLDFSELAPNLPLHIAAYLKQLYETAGEVEPDIPFDWRINHALKVITSKSGGGVCLEIGAGDGVMTSSLEKLFEQVYTLDWALSYAKKVEAHTQKAICLVGDAQFLPFSNHCIDFVVCTEVLEHVLIPTQLLLEIRRVLTAEGLCYLTVPNSIMRVLSRMRPTEMSHNSHVNFFNPYGLQNLLFRMGFEVIEAHTILGPRSGLRGMLAKIRYIARRRLTGMIIECLIKPLKDPWVFWKALEVSLGKSCKSEQ